VHFVRPGPILNRKSKSKWIGWTWN